MKRSRWSVFALALIAVSFSPLCVRAQSTQTLMGGDVDVRAAWGIESVTSKIQDDLSATWSAFGGVTLNGSTTLGLTLAANLTHPDVNYGYFGPVVRHVFQPDDLFHVGVGLVFAFAATKDYEREKSSLFDNFGNTSGEGFSFVEPAVYGELNLTARFRFRVGVGYRAAWGLDETTQYTLLTGVTQGDFSGPFFVIGVGS